MGVYSFFFLETRCPLCSKDFLSVEMEEHYLSCMARPRVRFNGEKGGKGGGGGGIWRCIYLWYTCTCGVCGRVRYRIDRQRREVGREVGGEGEK